MKRSSKQNFDEEQLKVEKNVFENNKKIFFPQFSLLLNINMKCGVFILYFLFKLTETNYAMLLITQKTTITQRF